MSLIEDLVEDILLRLDVEELTLYKIVCKSWYSLISSHRFAKARLKQHNNDSSSNKDLGHVRIAMPTYWKVPNENLFQVNSWEVVGSSNGLVCFYTEHPGKLILVSNPRTRELRKLPMPPLQNNRLLEHMFFSFGYDSLSDDYKLLMGTSDPTKFKETLFQVLSLKSNTWKPIGEFKYWIFYSRPGILFDGALHWLAFDYNASETKRVFLSFDLSREEFTAIIPESVDTEQRPIDSYVGIVEDHLCIFFCYNRDKHYDLPCNNIWVMRCRNGERFWEKLPDNYEMKYQVVHHMKTLEFTSSNNNRMSFFCDDYKCLSKTWFHIQSPLFVPSLVSPYVGRPKVLLCDDSTCLSRGCFHFGSLSFGYPYFERPSHAKNNKTSVKSWSLEGTIDGEGQQLQTSIRRWIIRDASERDMREIEAVYRHGVGETENFYFHEGNRKIKEIVTKIEGDTVSGKGVKINEKEK